MRLNPSPSQTAVGQSTAIAVAASCRRVQEQLDVTVLHVAFIFAHGTHGVVVRRKLHVRFSRRTTRMILQKTDVDGYDGFEELEQYCQNEHIFHTVRKFHIDERSYVCDIHLGGFERKSAHVNAVIARTAAIVWTV